MDTLSYLGQGFGVALSPYNLLTALCGTLIGTVVGLLPGLGPINGVALLLPLAPADRAILRLTISSRPDVQLTVSVPEASRAPMTVRSTRRGCSTAGA